MAPSNLGYSLREAGSHFTRNWTTSFGAVITIFLSLFMIGLFIVGSAMINSMIGSVQDTVKISAFISDDASDEDVEAFMEKIEGWDNVKNVEFKTKTMPWRTSRAAPATPTQPSPPWTARTRAPLVHHRDEQAQPGRGDGRQDQAGLGLPADR